MFLDITKRLQCHYDEKVVKLIEKAATFEELKKRLEEFKGVGSVSVNIFLLELRETLPEADPSRVRHLNLIKTDDSGKALEQLRKVWKENRIEKIFYPLRKRIAEIWKRLLYRRRM